MKKTYYTPGIETVEFDTADAVLINSPHGTLETPSEDEIEIELS